MLTHDMEHFENLRGIEPKRKPQVKEGMSRGVR